MPSGRKPNNNKKKNTAKPDRKPRSRLLGESYGDQHRAHHPEDNAEDSEGSSSGYESLTPVTTQKSAKDRLSKIEIDKPWNSPRQIKLKMDFSKAAMMEVETPTVAEYLCQPFEFSHENETQKVKDSGFKTPPFADPVKSVDQILAEVVSKLPFEFSSEETQKVKDSGFKTPTFVDPVKSVDQTLAEAASKLPFEFSPKETQKANDLGFKTPTFVDPVKSVDQTLAEVASKLPFEFSSEKETQKANDLGFKTPTFVDPFASVDQTLAEVASKLPSEFSSEKETQKANDLGFRTPTFVDPVASVDQTLAEVVSKIYNETKIKEKDDLAVAETHLEHTVINGIDKPPNSAEHAKIKIDEAAMMELEPPTVADYISQPFESSPEKGTNKVEDLGFKTPTFVDPVVSVDQTLVEVASQLDNNIKVQEKDDLAVAETRLEHTVINETDFLSKENEVQKLDSAKPKENLLQYSTNGKCPYCGRSGDDERQPLLASAPRPPEKASWKNCCGIFELFSGSTRN